MRIAVVFLLVTLAGPTVLGQGTPTLRIETEVPGLPSELFYGDIKVKPLRLRPGTNIPITIDDSDFFVHTHYIDFLSRMPEPEGFTFWDNEIRPCGTNAACIDVKRVNVSAAFFLNIANGIIVGKPGWEQALNANKAAFVLAFVQRPEFQAAYPNTMSADQFVTKLDTNAGLVLSSSEKAAIVAALSLGPTDFARRADALRAVAENANLQQREFNKAFVLTQYFGYLRRNPDSAPDTNFGGFNFWLGKLNQFNGNFIQAEMVKAFITSIEYRQRF
jgi:hypothetical protein